MLDPLDHPLILDALQDPVSVLLPDGRFAYVNPAAAQLLGRTPAELLGTSIWELYPAGVQSPFHESFRRALVEQAEQRLRLHWAAHQLWLEFRFLPCRTGITVLSRNITEEQDLHRALEENEERLRLAQQAAGIGTWDWSQTTGKVTWSEGIWRMLGLEPGSIKPDAAVWNAAIHPLDREQACRRSDEAVAHGERYEEEFRICRPDGSYIWILCLGQVLRDPEGRAVRFLGVNLDITARKEAERRLAESEARYRFITEALPQVIWTSAADGTLLECNRHWYELTGLTEAQMRDGGGLEGAVHPEDAAQIRAAWPEYLARGEEYPFEYRVRRATDGAYRWHYGRIMPIRDAEGAVVRWLGTAFDSQELKDAAEAVQRREAFHRALLEQAGEGFWLTDPEGRCLEINQAACELLGYSREELLGTVVRELFHPEDQPARAEDLRRVRSGSTVRSERRLRRKDGSYALVEGTARPFQGNTIVFFHDVTQRRAAEEAVRAREQEFRAVWEMTAVGAAQADPATGRFTRVNRRLCEILGYSEAELLSRTLRDVTHPDDYELGTSFVREALAGTRESWELQKRYVRRDGQVIWGQVAGTILRGDDGLPYRVLGMMYDITESRRAHEALVEESQRKDQFLAMLAHELRNPLAPVLNAAHILRLRPDDSGVSVRQGEVIERNARHLSRLVDDLLEVSRINQGKIELRKERVRLREVVEQAVTSVQPFLHAHRHELSVTMPPEELPVYGDPVRIVQILVNLLTNAAKYTDNGGRIEMSAAREGEAAVLRVRDNGRGMDPALLTRVFELFVQGDHSLARSEGGLGIGLTLTRSLAELHGGTVSAASDGPGHGSEFTVRLPLDARQDTDHQPAAASP